MTISPSEVRAADQRWDTNKIKTLIDGYAVVTITDATGRQYDELREGRTAFDLRNSALDTGNVDDILDPLQLDIAIKAVAKTNNEAAGALFLRARGHGFEETNPYELSDVVGSHKRDRHLLDRGIELVRRHEGGRAVERSGTRVGSAVCWKCMERPAVPGELCEQACDGKTDAQRRQLAGLKRGANSARQPYDPTIVADPAMMTQDEIDAEIQLLADTQGVSVADAKGVPRDQRDAPIAGGRTYNNMVVPYGSSPGEIVGVEWSPL